MEDDSRVRLWAPVCQAVALLLSPYAEVVLHDPDTDEILAIWNPISARTAGDPSLLGELEELDPSARDVFGPYGKVLADGRQLSSVSAILRDADGKPTAVLCVNLDRTPLEDAAAVLSAFGAPTVARPEPLFEQDWWEKVQHVVGAHVRDCGRPVERLTRADRLDVIRLLEEAGIFTVRNAPPAVARALKISRSALYSLRAELKAPDKKGEPR